MHSGAFWTRFKDVLVAVLLQRGYSETDLDRALIDIDHIHDFHGDLMSLGTSLLRAAGAARLEQDDEQGTCHAERAAKHLLFLVENEQKRIPRYAVNRRVSRLDSA